jgi:hypothetical protein
MISMTTEGERGRGRAVEGVLRIKVIRSLRCE